MAEYIVTQDNSAFHVRIGDASGPVIATFSNRLAAERFAENKRSADESSRTSPPDGPPPA